MNPAHPAVFMFHLHTFGGLYLERDGARIETLTGQRKSLALLALLAAAGDRGVSRAVLLAYLWPESDEDRARTSLRQLVHSLRTHLRTPDAVISSAELRLNPAVISSDVGAFRAADARGEAEAAITLYAGPFLKGFHLRGADEFERWSAAERADLAEREKRLLEQVAGEALARGDAKAAVQWGRRLTNADPLSGRAAVALMHALDAAGERAAALQHARVYEALLQQEVGGAPDPAVIELVERLRTAAPAAGLRAAATPQAPNVSSESRGAEQDVDVTVPSPPAAVADPLATLTSEGRGTWRAAWWVGAALVVAIVAVALALPAGRGDRSGAAAEEASLGEAPSVAVLPFTNISGDPANEPLSDGLTDELIGALGSVPGLKVAGRTSVFAVRDRKLGLTALGDTLGVQHVVEASVRRSGDRIKVTAHLVNVRDNAVLWTNTYDRTMTDVFAMQEEIARSIVAALRVRLVGSRSEPLLGLQTSDPAAYDLYLRGRHIFHARPDREGVLQARRYFEQAVERDPEFARAHAALSDVHTRLAVFGFAPPREEFARARTAAERALALDSNLAEAHAAMAHVACVAEFEWRGAERGFRRALALNPGYVFARLPFAICLMSEGRFAEAIAQLDTAVAADPLAAAPSNVLGRAYVAARQPDRALEHLHAALELNPVLDLAYQQVGHAYLLLARHEDAIVAFERAAALSGVRDSAHLAYAYARSGRRDVAERIVRGLVASDSARHLPPYHIAVAYAGLGEADEVFRWLERGLAERGSFMGWIKATPAFEGVHDDPRWKRLLARMGLEP